MELWEAVFIAFAAGYVALTFMGIFVTEGAQGFVTKAIGRDPIQISASPRVLFMGLVYVFAFMWAVGLVSTWERGRLDLYLKRAKQTVEDEDLSPEEIHSLRLACEELEETGRIVG